MVINNVSTVDCWPIACMSQYVSIFQSLWVNSQYSLWQEVNFTYFSVSYNYLSSHFHIKQYQILKGNFILNISFQHNHRHILIETGFHFIQAPVFWYWYVHVVSVARNTKFLVKWLMTVNFPHKNINVITRIITFTHNYSTLMAILSLKMKGIIFLKILESLESAISLWFMPLSINLELTLYVKLSKMLQHNENDITLFMWIQRFNTSIK
jgi:hypothetical protein